MEELRKFREINHLTQDVLGSYLGIKKSFISRVENGQVALPFEKFTKLLNNDMGWDVGPLINADKVEISIPDSNYDSGINESEKLRMISLFDRPVRNSAASNKKWNVKHIEMLEQRIKQLEQQNAEYWELIKKLTDR